MNEIGEGIGSALEGSLLARAIEPDSGAKVPHPHQPANCLNCGTKLVGAYCHACGQQAHLHRTIGAFMHDLLHGALHFEGKMWRTLPMLALRPGTLTRRYIDGARARFVSPMALFLFSVFLMFAVFQALGITAPSDISGEPDVVVEIGSARELAESKVADARAELADLSENDPRRAAVESRLAEAEDALESTQAVAAPDPGDVAASSAESDAGGMNWIGDNIVEKWRKQPELMLYKLQANSYKFSWLLIPLSIPFVWLLFAWKRRFNGYDHAIFVTYSLGFMSLLFVAVSLLDAAGVWGALLALVVVLVPPVHLYKHLRGAYSLTRLAALWRLVVLLAMILVILILFLQALLVMGAF